ncbi:MAG: hypothetical protein RBJ76_05235 [Stenomitos frigidus ULC029]
MVMQERGFCKSGKNKHEPDAWAIDIHINPERLQEANKSAKKAGMNPLASHRPFYQLD